VTRSHQPVTGTLVMKMSVNVAVAVPLAGMVTVLCFPVDATATVLVWPSAISVTVQRDPAAPGKNFLVGTTQTYLNLMRSTRCSGLWR
jgi:hypothetical protein